MKPGDRVTGEDGKTFRLGEQLAYGGKEGCQDVRCTRMDGKCVGWHCPYCDKPTGSQGHDCPEKPR